MPEHDVVEIGRSATNSRPDSTHVQSVEAKYLWSFAQEAALLVVSEPRGDQWRLITDPERRARRIAAAYADLYFKSAERTQGKLQFYWVALAAFVVKGVAEALRYTREEVLSGGFRTWTFAKAVSELASSNSPYDHAERIYAALAKGNVWLFMDIYPWLWFFLEYGVTPRGELLESRLRAAVPERSWSTLQRQSKGAVQWLPFGRDWLHAAQERMANDPVFAVAAKLFQAPNGLEGFEVRAELAHAHVREHAPASDVGYHVPSGPYWARFSEAFYVLDAERRELARLAADSATLGRVDEVREMRATPAIQETFAALCEGFKAQGGAKATWSLKEVNAIAHREQVEVLQPLIYDDNRVKETLDLNHRMRYRFGRWLSPAFNVVFAAAPTTEDPRNEVEFDPPADLSHWLGGTSKSLADRPERMEFVKLIVKRFNARMISDHSYMEAELSQIRGWLHA